MQAPTSYTQKFIKQTHQHRFGWPESAYQELIEPQTPSFKASETSHRKSVERPQAKSMYLSNQSKAQQPTTQKSVDQNNVLTKNVKKVNSRQFRQGLDEGLEELYRKEKQYLRCLYLTQHFERSKTLDASILAKATQDQSINNSLQHQMQDLDNFQSSNMLPVQNIIVTEPFDQKKTTFLSAANLPKYSTFKSQKNITSIQTKSQKSKLSQTKQQQRLSVQKSEKVLKSSQFLESKSAKGVNQNQKIKREHLIKSIMDLQVTLQMTLNILEASDYEEAILNIGRLGRMETIVNAKMTVDGNQLYKLASKLKQ